MDELKDKIKFVEEIINSEDEDALCIINFILVSLFSSDSLWCKEDCDRGVEELTLFKKAFEIAAIPEETRKEYLEIINSGIEICKRDGEMYSIKGK